MSLEQISNAIAQEAWSTPTIQELDVNQTALNIGVGPDGQIIPDCTLS